MSCGAEDCGCGCQDLVQLEKPSKQPDALKGKTISEKGHKEEPASSSETPS